MWVRGHSRSLKVVPFESLGTVSYSPSIVIMAVCLAISEIFNVKWPDLEIWVWGRSRWSTRSSAVAKRPRDASCLYSFYTLEWCGYPMVKKIPSYHYSFWHDPRTWKKSPFSCTAANIFVSTGDATAIITQYVAWMERQFDACQSSRRMYLSIFNSFPIKRCLSQCVSPKIVIFTTLFPLGMPLGQSR